MISPRTEVFCVIGSPVAHSLSPLMHNTAFRETGYDGIYLAFQVSDIESAVRGIRALGIRGVSVTIPHKISVMPFLDEIDEMARKIGAVNTIVRRGDRLKGLNTDCTGAVGALLEKTPLRDKRVLILGAGGAARAVGFGIAAREARVTIANRTEEKGAGLARDLRVACCPLDDIGKRSWDVLVNTTAVGMHPKTDAMPVPESVLRPGQVVMDIVYNPLETTLLKRAREKGCITVDGAAMFVSQGARQFECWTGQKAPAAEMVAKVRAALSGAASKKLTLIVSKHETD